MCSETVSHSAFINSRGMECDVVRCGVAYGMVACRVCIVCCVCDCVCCCYTIQTVFYIQSTTLVILLQYTITKLQHIAKKRQVNYGNSNSNFVLVDKQMDNKQNTNNIQITEHMTVFGYTGWLSLMACNNT